MKGEKDQSTETEKRNGQWRAEEGYAKSVGKNGNLSLRSYFHRRFVRRVFSFDALREHHGLAKDARILQSPLSRPDPLVVPQGCYYRVDAGFADAPGFLVPYRGVLYHLKDYRGRTPDNAKELFNKWHLQARNVIERALDC
ncbi:hypothetical protein AAC387_Pa01g2534 [Persea americana]